MATPAAVLSIMVKAQGVQATSSQLTTLDKNARKAGTGLAATEKHARKSGAAFATLGKAAGLAGVAVGAAGLAAGVKSAVSEFREAQKTGAQTAAVLKSTGNAAKVTQKHIENLAGAISRKSGIDDEAIQTGANLLLTFKDIRNETGRGNKIFDQATQVITDMSVAMKQGLKPSAIQVGKALNDPIKGMTALGRVGVTFTEDQKKQVAALVKNGDKLGAQKIILRELKSEFAGSAAAQATAGDKLKVAWGNLAEAAGGVLVPALDKVATFFTKVIDQFVRGQGIAKFVIPVFTGIRDAVVSIATNTAVIKFFTDFKDAMVILFNTVSPFVQDVALKLVAFFKDLPGPVQTAVGAVAGFAALFLVSGPLLVGIAAFVAAAVLIKRNWGPIVGTVNTVRDAVTGWVAKNRADIDIVIKAFKDVEKVARAVFEVAFPVLVAFAKRQMEGLKTAISGALQLVGGVIKVFLGLLHGDWSRAWQGLKDIAVGGLKTAYGAVKTATAPFREIGARITAAIVDGLAGLGHMILQRFKEAAEFVKDKITGLFSGVGGLIGKGVGKIPGIGDGIGKGGGPAGKGSAALMGANSSLAPFARMGAGFGLHVSSGLRPGAITSSGNPSYHGTGEAIDVAGDPRGMIGFFNAMKSKFGGRLAELIYTPGGQGIKNGAPFTYTGRVARDHFDHVHVALDTGKPGPGDGIGKTRGARKALTGDGYGKSQLEALWQRAGGPASAANIAAAVALAESGGSSTAMGRNSNGTVDRGLWQINSIHGAKSTFNPLGNAKAAVSISSGGRNWNPWTVFKTGKYKQFLGKGGAASRKAPKKVKVKRTTIGDQKVPAPLAAAAAHGSNIKGGQSEAAFNAMNDQRLAQEQHNQEMRAAQQEEEAYQRQRGDDAAQQAADEAATKAMEELTAQLALANTRLALQTALAQEVLRKYNVSQSEYGTLQKALASTVSGEIAGRVGLGFMSPGFAGGGSRY